MLQDVTATEASAVDGGAGTLAVEADSDAFLGKLFTGPARMTRRFPNA